MVFIYDGVGATTLWLPLAIHGRYNPRRWDYCIDCGIDKGQYSIHYSHIFQSVIAVDANIREEAIEFLANSDNITFLEKCLWSTSDENITWYELPTATFLSTIDKEYAEAKCTEWDIDKNTIKSYQLTTDTLDNVINTPVDFLKIDCEQADADILLGAETLIQNYRPTIQVEDNGSAVEEYLRALEYTKFNHDEVNCPDSVYLPKEIIIAPI